MIESPESFFARRPVRPLAQPAEMKVNSCCIKDAFEAGRRAVGPPRPDIRSKASANNAFRPMNPFSERGKINFTGRNRGRLPIQHEQFLPPQQQVLGIALAVN